MDSSIWATWYDLDETSKDSYLYWLHNSHLPVLLQRQGYAWAAHYKVQGKPHPDFMPEEDHQADVKRGQNYLLLIGAASARVFCDPGINELTNSFDSDSRLQLDKQKELRSCLYIEESRVDGPEAFLRQPGTAPGPFIQMGSYNVGSVIDEFELATWYAQDRLVAMARMSGCIGARKLVATAGWAKHAVLYEFSSRETWKENFVDNIAKWTVKELNWSENVINSTSHAPGSPSVGSRIWPR